MPPGLMGGLVGGGMPRGDHPMTPGTLGWGIQQGLKNGTWTNEGGDLRYVGPQAGGGQGLLGDIGQLGHGLLGGMPGSQGQLREMDAKARLRKAMLSGQNS
jgi:hypothetical protein